MIIPEPGKIFIYAYEEDEGAAADYARRRLKGCAWEVVRSLDPEEDAEGHLKRCGATSSARYYSRSSDYDRKVIKRLGIKNPAPA
jgi:hypothetical protein